MIPYEISLLFNNKNNIINYLKNKNNRNKTKKKKFCHSHASLNSQPQIDHEAFVERAQFDNHYIKM